MRKIAYILILFSLSACYGKPDASSASRSFHTITYHFKSESSDSQMVEKTAAIMKRRLEEARIYASVTRNANVLTVTVANPDGLDINRLLAARDAVLLKIIPNGPTYVAGGSKPFKYAYVVNDPLSDRPALIFQMTSPQAFQRFTNGQAGHFIGFYVDGKLIQQIYLTGPFNRGGGGRIWGGKFSIDDLRVMAAQIGGGSLPAAVHAI